jgi:hypothetical protein
MDTRTLKAFSDHLLLGGLIVGAGSAAGLWLPLGVALLLLSIALCRVCWIEENIHQDLLNAENLPAGYRACLERRSFFLSGSVPEDKSQEHDCPKRIASALRLQAHAWAAFGWGLAAGAALPAGAPLTYGAGVLALTLALRHADYLAVGASLIASGKPLPRRLIAGRGPLSSLAIIPRRPD